MGARLCIVCPFLVWKAVLMVVYFLQAFSQLEGIYLDLGTLICNQCFFLVLPNEKGVPGMAVTCIL